METNRDTIKLGNDFKTAAASCKRQQEANTGLPLLPTTGKALQAKEKYQQDSLPIMFVRPHPARAAHIPTSNHGLFCLVHERKHELERAQHDPQNEHDQQPRDHGLDRLW